MVAMMPTPTPVAQSPAIPLNLAGRDETLIIRQVRGSQSLRRRLMDLGLTQGARVRVIRNDMPDPIIIAVKEDGRLALGRGMAQQILVSPAAEERHAGRTVL